MIDIVTVVFREELPILKVQAQSVDLYCQDIGIQTIYVVVNDDQSIVQEIDPAWWGSLSSHVKIIHRQEFGCEFVADGWLTQQLLKILCAALSQNQYTMILDAKTILVKPLELNYLFDLQGRQIWGYTPIQPVFKPAGLLVSKLFDIDIAHVAGPSGVPFLFHGNTVREMVSMVTKITNQSFPAWFQQMGMITEFILYTGYILYRDGTLDRVYSKNYPIKCIPGVNICHSETDQFDKKILTMLQDNILTVGIHRNCWNKLTSNQQALYVTILQSRGITQAKSIL